MSVVDELSTAESEAVGPMYKTVTHLADGRELIYYDHRPGRHPATDARRLPDRPEAGGVRFDPRTGDWVVVAGHRQDRIFLPAADECPLCPSAPSRPTEVPDAAYDVVVFENRFPVLTGIAAGVLEPDGVAALKSMPANGRCEVICFADTHDLSVGDLTPVQLGLVLDAWIDRTRELSGRPDVAQVFCFENRGREIGVTQPHPHGQIYAYPFVPSKAARTVERAVAHRRAHGGNLFDDLLAAERDDGERLVAGNEEWTAFVPYAARWPYEVHLYPTRRRADLTGLDGAGRDAFAEIYLDLLRRFDRLFDAPAPYISAWQQAPTAPGAEEFGLHLELFTNRRSSDRLKYLAGTEAALGVFSNDIVPEQAARRLRELA